MPSGPDGQILVSGGDGTITLGLKDAPPSGTSLGGYETLLYSVAFSPDGQTLASGGDDGAPQAVGREIYPAIGDPCRPDIRARCKAWPAARMAKF